MCVHDMSEMLAAGAKAELADEINGGKGRRVVDASSASDKQLRESRVETLMEPWHCASPYKY